MSGTPSISRAMKSLEAGRLEEAEAAFAALAGPAGDGVIARFRRAECLSRLGRHDEAVAEAQTAQRDAPGTPSTALWLAWVLAEAGRTDDAAAVVYPKGHEEFTDCVRDGFAALAKIAANVKSGRDDVRKALLASHHFPLFSLALRAAERDRLLGGGMRFPDPLSVWSVHVSKTDFDETGDGPPPTPPEVRDAALPSRSELKAATEWLRTWGASSYQPRLVTALRSAKKPPEDVDLLEAEMLLAAGRLDDVEALITRVRADTKKDEESAELCVTVTRAAHLAGRATPPDEAPGFSDALDRAKPDVAWLRTCAAILGDRPLDARRHAEEVADPSHAEYVEAALLAWAARSPG